MRRHSGYVLTLLISAMAVTACGGAAYLYVTRMPDLETADIRGLLRWLVTCDLARESTHTQEQLLARLEEQLLQGVQLDASHDQLTIPQRQQLLDNADLLGRLWFLKQVDRYAALSTPQKSTFLDRQIDQLEHSGAVTALASLMCNDDNAVSGTAAASNAAASNVAVRNPAATSPWVSLANRIRRWTASLEPMRKAQADEFIAAVQGNLLLRTLRASFSAKG
jgi:hypothetical protein